MLRKALVSAGLAASLSACGSVAGTAGPIAAVGRDAPRTTVEVRDPAPYVRGTLRPYAVRGRTYTPVIDESYDQVGVASWYGDAFHGRPTATGEVYDMNGLSAAHTTLPLPSLAEVTNLETGQSIVVRVNDRGPFVGDRIIDLSRGAADALGVRSQGLAEVRVRWLGPAPVGGGTGRPSGPAQASQPQTPPDFGDTDPYFVQAGTFANRDNAEALRHRFGGGRTTIQDVEVRGERMYRVLIGPWTGRQEAERQRSTLAGQGLFDAILVRAQ
jgi:rare lipoprotein A